MIRPVNACPCVTRSIEEKCGRVVEVVVGFGFKALQDCVDELDNMKGGMEDGVSYRTTMPTTGPKGVSWAKFRDHVDSTLGEARCVHHWNIIYQR